MTKVPATLRGAGITLAVCLAVLPIPSAWGQQPTPPLITPTQAAPTQATQPQTHRPGPAESLYLQLSDVGLDSTRVFRVRGASLGRSAIHITLEDGTIAFTKDVVGRITGAFFEGYGELLLAPPNDVERKSMSLFTGMAILEERFSTAYFRFNDNTAAELQPGFRAPEDPEKFIAQWDQTARNLAHADAMRLLASFSGMLPLASGTLSEGSVAAKAADLEDRMLHVRLQGNTLGVFDVFFDSTAGEQVEAGQVKTGEDGSQYYDIWTSFSIENAERRPPVRKQTVQTLPAEMESQEDPILVRSFVIDAHVKPPKQLDAEVEMHLDAVRGGSRFMEFELSRFLQIQTVEADGKPVEFIQNPALEGSHLARNGNDVVAVILPEPPRKGQKITLRFVYAGEVLAEAGKGLLYVGARGTWYPNRGMAMADFDLTFHYPPGWTLLATGKPAPIPRPSLPGQTKQPQQTPPQAAGGEQAARWVSERPIPVAGFNLGKYVRGTAQAGNVTVDTYATGGVERDFPKPPPEAQSDVPPRPRGIAPTPMIAPLAPALEPSPARSATAVAEVTARAIRYYADRFGPFPYGQLALTQLPGRESQGWPGLIFLSSYAFLTPEERQELHVTPMQTLLEQLVPAHEAAHQWWGDLITWATYRDQWFSEGLANYCSLMVLQEKNPAGFRLVMEKYRKDLVEKNQDGNFPKDAGPVTLGNRLLSSHFPEGYEDISYGRGTWLFHMLRSMMQDAGAGKESNLTGVEEPFMKSLRKLRERYAGKTISTRELLEVFAEDLPPSLRYEGKASLDWFLEGWVNGTSLPRLELQGVKFTAKANAMVVSGVIRQKDAADDLVTSVPIYAIVSGRAPVIVGRVFADGVETPFHLSVPAGTHKLLLDPNETILTSPK